MGNEDWKSSIKIESRHQACICQSCNKQIGRKAHRMTFDVTSQWSSNVYSKHFHLTCVLNMIEKSIAVSKVNVKDTKIDSVKQKVVALRKEYEKIKKFEDSFNV